VAGDLTPAPYVGPEHDLCTEVADLGDFPFHDRVDLILALGRTSSASASLNPGRDRCAHIVHDGLR
jgi:hypothetical protein